jgi:hypothetical protein
MVRRVMSDRDTMPGSVAPVQALLTVTQETFAALRAAHRNQAPAGKRATQTDRRAKTQRPAVLPPAGTTDDEHTSEAVIPTPGSALDVVGRLRGTAPVTDESGQAWPASEIARALCDCTLTRAVVGTEQADLNLGRSTRLFKRQHWLALYAAGTTTCAIAGCGMPLAYTELHHITWWYEHHGTTDQANCLPYCSFHHHEIHRKGILVTRLPDGRIQHHHPDGRPYGGAPPGDPDHTPTSPPDDLLQLLSA